MHFLNSLFIALTIFNYFSQIVIQNYFDKMYIIKKKVFVSKSFLFVNFIFFTKLLHFATKFTSIKTWKKCEICASDNSIIKFDKQC